jgi:hypothetical protein
MFKKILPVALALTALAANLVAGCGSPPAAAQPVVKKVDHVTISCSDPEGLFKTLTETLGLPAAWALSSYGGFTTGGVNAGDVNIETIRFNSMPPAMPTFVYGIVFQSYPLSDVMNEFQQRGADPGDPEDQMRDVNGKQVKVWTNVTLNALCTDSYIVYLCEYSPEMAAALASHTTSGPLGEIGVLGVKEIIVGSTDCQQLRQQWSNIFAPAPMSSDGSISFDSGPAVRISPRAENSIVALVLEVSSLKQARTFLRTNGLLGDDSGTEISIDPTKVQGLDIRLIEKT